MPVEIPDEPEIESIGEEYFVPGVAHVQFSEEMVKVLESSQTKSGDVDAMRLAEFNEAVKSIGVTSVRRLFPDAGEFEARHRKYGLHKWYVVEYDDLQPMTKASSSLKDIPGTERVEPVLEKKLMGTGRHYFNDKYAYYQWNYYNDGKDPTKDKTDSRFVKGMDINVIPVWENYTAGSPDVIVAIIDEGVDPGHEDLAPVLDLEISRCFLPGKDPEVIVPGDHGCHTGGTVAAVNNNGKGVVGVAGGKDGKGGVRLMSCVVGDPVSGKISGNTEEAFVWAADHGAVIANNSWGVSIDDTATAQYYAQLFEQGRYAPELKAAIDYFIDNAGYDVNGKQVGPVAGGVVLFSSGNANIGGDVYSAYSRVISVGALNAAGKRASYSNYGDYVDIAAPGGDGNTAEELILSCATVDKGGYVFMAGTSMACPHATGVAALLASYFGGEGFTADMLKERLIYGAKNGVLDLDQPLGRKLDALGSITYDKHVQPKIECSEDADMKIRSHEKTTVVFNVIDNDDNTFDVEFESDCEAATAVIKGNVVTMTVDALMGQPGEYNATVTVGRGTMFETVCEFPFVILENHAPVNAALIDGQVVGVKQGAANVNLAEFLNDEDGENLSYTVTVSNESIVSAKVTGSSLSLSGVNYGNATVTVTGTDARGLHCTQAFGVITRDKNRVVDIYPIPVSDILYLRPGENSAVEFNLYSSNGAKVISFSGELTPFGPAKFDVRDFAAGKYTAVVKVGEEEITQTVVKY